MASGTLYLFDTSILLHLVRGGPVGEHISTTYGLANVLRRPLVGIVSHGELMAMAARRGWGDARTAALNAILTSLVTLDLNDPAILEAYVAVDQAGLAATGGSRALSNNDMWIAATARAAGAVLLTSDKDFLHLDPSVCRVEYIDPRSARP